MESADHPIRELVMVDTYTKICLTVIAVSLAVIGFRGLPMIDPAYAQGGVQKIAICERDGKKCLTDVGRGQSFYFHRLP